MPGLWRRIKFTLGDDWRSLARLAHHDHDRTAIEPMIELNYTNSRLYCCWRLWTTVVFNVESMEKPDVSPQSSVLTRRFATTWRPWLVIADCSVECLRSLQALHWLQCQSNNLLIVWNYGSIRCCNAFVGHWVVGSNGVSRDRRYHRYSESALSHNECHVFPSAKPFLSRSVWRSQTPSTGLAIIMC